MRRFHRRLTLEDVYEVMSLSTEVDVGRGRSESGGELDATFYIRKKKEELNEDYVKFFGFDVEKIKKLTLKQFYQFLKLKKSFE